ncbi:MAG: hypothetical protein JJ850_11615 [Kordiimonadaceae bacterium]|nr:hypothetical protein [Kordiimonadaceae bacterium]MBO6568765.1 hypothetical protein [Kordiimonadaceae bacterium]MBO6965259.1 hypothetical protein [Kordiimonadaceae bacterium]
MTDEKLLAAFEAATLTYKQFTHRAHVNVAWLYVRDFTLPVASEKFIRHLKALNKVHGVSANYHETITWFMLLLIADRQGKNPVVTFEDFEANNSDMMRDAKGLLARYYKDETLWGDHARRCFTLPDKLAL